MHGIDEGRSDVERTSILAGRHTVAEGHVFMGVERHCDERDRERAGRLTAERVVGDAGGVRRPRRKRGAGRGVARNHHGRQAARHRCRRVRDDFARADDAGMRYRRGTRELGRIRGRRLGWRIAARGGTRQQGHDDPRLALPLLAALRTIPDIEVGDNAPYSGQLKGDTLYRHGTGRGLAHALVEVRQDLILGPEGQAEWATRLARALGKVLSDAGATLHTVELHGSITDQERRATPAPGANRKGTPAMDEKTRIELEAAAFRRLVAHLRERTDVQNIDLMELAGFCRNCLANWYQDAAAANGISLSKDEAREIVYGMAYDDWKAKFQTDAPAKPRRAG